MKYIVITICLVAGLLFEIPNSSRTYQTINYNKIYSDGKCTVSKSPTESLNNNVKDVLMAMLTPYIDKAINDFYGTPYSVDPWANSILSIERPNGEGTFYFIVKLSVMPYTGPHNFIGLDYITFSVSTSEIHIEKFEHIRG